MFRGKRSYALLHTDKTKASSLILSSAIAARPLIKERFSFCRELASWRASEGDSTSGTGVRTQTVLPDWDFSGKRGEFFYESYQAIGHQAGSHCLAYDRVTSQQSEPCDAENNGPGQPK